MANPFAKIIQALGGDNSGVVRKRSQTDDQELRKKRERERIARAKARRAQQLRESK